MGENAKCCARAHTAGREEKQGLWSLEDSQFNTGWQSLQAARPYVQSTVFALSLCSQKEKKKQNKIETVSLCRCPEIPMHRPNTPETQRSVCLTPK